MARWMPELETFFHYRNLDVSTLKELCRRWQPAIYKGFQKRAMHTALADIHESIDELKYYREHFLIPSASGQSPIPAGSRKRVAVRILAAGSRTFGLNAATTSGRVSMYGPPIRSMQ
jgi:oligoribonuclease